jgi:hypothetical protein
MKEGEVHVLREFEVQSGEHHYSFGITTKMGMLALFWYSIEDGESRVQFMETMKRTWICRYQWYIKTRIWIARKKFLNSLKVIEAINTFIGEADEISTG